MNAMEKVAWTEFVVSLAAVVVATLLFPWLGPRASGAFGLLGLIAFSLVFVRRRGNRVVFDERDNAIRRRAAGIGIGSAWMTLAGALIAATMWQAHADVHAVSTVFLNWLIWVQFAICYGVTGLASVIMYRRQRHAA